MAMGGVGEAALLGAAMGGGSAMLTGGDPLKGALMGGLTGGAGAGIGGVLNAAAAPPVVSLAEVATPAFTEAVAPAITENLVASNVANQGILSGGLPTNISNEMLKVIAPSAKPNAVMPAAAPVGTRACGGAP